MAGLTQELVLRRLQAYAQRWGGSLREISEHEFDELNEQADFSHSPFSSWDIGVDYNRKTTCFSAFARPEDIATFTATLVHEMGHVFACQQPPNDSEEFDFLGWEWALAKRVGLSFNEFCMGNKEYMVSLNDHPGETYEIGALHQPGRWQDTTTLRRVFSERKAAAISRGLLVKGRPAAIR